MNQSRLGSLIEAFANVVIGFGINYTANLIILPMYGFHIGLGANFTLGCLYTIVSVIRSYALRRWFNARLQDASHRLAAILGSKT